MDEASGGSRISILQQAAQYLNQVCYDDLPKAAVDLAKQAVLDYSAVAIAGSDQPVVNNLRSWAQARGQIGSVSLTGNAGTLNAEHAALVNAAAGHALDFDDTSWATIGHPSTVILPALFVQSEINTQQGIPVSGKAILIAYIAAVEVCHKIAELMMPLTSQNGWHTTGVFYGLATVAGLCQLQRVDEETTCIAMALALSNASGIRSNFGTQAKPYHAGMAVKGGMESLSLAQAGVTASPFALEGEDGFIQCYASAELALKARQLKDPVSFGTDYNMVTQGYAFKKYPNCSGTHPSCDLILQLIDEHSLNATDIKQIECGVSLLGPKELVSNHPKSVVEARFSLQYAIACALVYRQITLAEYCDEKVQDSRIQDIMPRINMSVDKDLAKLGFIGTAPIKLKITLVSGQEIYAENDLAIGNPEKPFSEADIKNKFLLCTQKLTEHKQKKLLSQLLELEKVTSVTVITQLMTGK